MGLKQIAEETVQTLERGNYTATSGVVDIADVLRNCIEQTQCYSPDMLTSIREQILSQPKAHEQMAFELVNETTLQGSRRVVEGDPSQRVGALNFASAKHPGGGFLGGAKAQEESLARSSGLYKSLLQCTAFYSFHRSQKTSLYSDRMIYSPKCPVIRVDAGDWLDKPYLVDFITSPAPNAGAIQTNEPHNKSKIIPTLQERANKLLALAAQHGCDVLILGAWGCGAFRNDPQSVASVFWELLKPEGLYWCRFRKVLFSVLDTSNTKHIYEAFASAFKPVL